MMLNPQNRFDPLLVSLPIISFLKLIGFYFCPTAAKLVSGVSVFFPKHKPPHPLFLLFFFFLLHSSCPYLSDGFSFFSHHICSISGKFFLAFLLHFISSFFCATFSSAHMLFIFLISSTRCVHCVLYVCIGCLLLKIRSGSWFQPRRQ